MAAENYVKKLVTLTEDQQAWLKEETKKTGIPGTELVRKAIEMYREAQEKESK